MTISIAEPTVFDLLTKFTEKYNGFINESIKRPKCSFRQAAGYGGATTGYIFKLKLEEYQELKAIMEAGKDEFIFEPFSMGMMDFSLRIYQHPTAAGVPPHLLFVLGGQSLPDELRIKAKKIAPGCILDDTFNEYSPFSHSEENKKWLEKYDMESAYGLDHYDY